ncbi:tetratricopeptide repeat protein [Chloroflexi bacterium TSY]|nr:tetratricopeptide repeat protein [Chloroflexi bacterium TSY]
MLQRVADAFDNIVAACHYLSDQLQSGDNVVQFAQLLNDYLPILTVYCNRRGLYREGQRILRYILDALDRLPADQVAQDAAVSRLHFQTQIEQAHALMPLGRYQEARDTLLSFIPRSRSPTNEEQLPHALSRLGAAYRQLGELAEAEQSLSQALALYERIDGQIDLQRKIALALLELGSVKFDRALYKDAHIYFQRALAIYEDAGDVGGVARCLHAMGIAYEADGDIEQAAPYYERGYRLALRAGNSVQVAVLLAKLGNCAYQAGNTDEALEKYLAAIDVFRQSGHMPWLTDRLIKVAAIYIERAELDIAAIHLVDALTFVQQNNLSLFEADALAVAARLLAHMDQHALAVSMATFASGSKHLQDGYLQFCETVLHTLHETMDAAAYDRAQTFGRDSSSMPMIDEAIHALD